MGFREKTPTNAVCRRWFVTLATLRTDRRLAGFAISAIRPAVPDSVSGRPLQRSRRHSKVLISEGFRVFGSVRKQADADRLQKEFGNGFVPPIMDITDADAVQKAARKVGSLIGDQNLLGLVNNAGIVVSGPLFYHRPSEFRRQLDVNMIAPLVVIQAFAPCPSGKAA